MNSISFPAVNAILEPSGDQPRFVPPPEFVTRLVTLRATSITRTAPAEITAALVPSGGSRGAARVPGTPTSPRAPRERPARSTQFNWRPFGGTYTTVSGPGDVSSGLALTPVASGAGSPRNCMRSEERRVG